MDQNHHLTASKNENYHFSQVPGLEELKSSPKEYSKSMIYHMVCKDSILNWLSHCENMALSEFCL